MTNLWNKLGVPHKAWRCVRVVDLRSEQGEDYVPEVCEMCGQENLRYVHTMTHDEYDGELSVGCICAGKMEEDYDAPRQRERNLANLASRRGRWLDRKWRTSRKGNQYLNVDGCNVAVYPDKFNPNHWRYRITTVYDQETQFSDRIFPTSDQAKLALFDELAELLG